MLTRIVGLLRKCLAETRWLRLLESALDLEDASPNQFAGTAAMFTDCIALGCMADILHVAS